MFFMFIDRIDFNIFIYIYFFYYFLICFYMFIFFYKNIIFNIFLRFLMFFLYFQYFFFIFLDQTLWPNSHLPDSNPILSNDYIHNPQDLLGIYLDQYYIIIILA